MKPTLFELGLMATLVSSLSVACDNPPQQCPSCDTLACGPNPYVVEGVCTITCPCATGGATGMGGAASGPGGVGGSVAGTSAAGGSAAMAGSGGTMSTAPPPPGGTINHGLAPTSNVLGAAQTAYTWFKGLISSCGDGTSRVASNGNETYSEAIAYGMLLSVNHDDQATFDPLWAYYKAHSAPNGLMYWKISGCQGPTQDATGPASDAEVDAAMALIQAHCRWGGNYLEEALSLLDNVINVEAVSTSDVNLLKPGDWGGATAINPSYFSPGYFRIFAYHHAARSAFWLKLADDTYTLLERGANPTTGLVPDWMNSMGQPATAGENLGYDYYYDAARVPWRVAIDYVWYGTPAAKAFLDRMTNWVDASGGIGQVGDRYSLDGQRLSGDHNATFVGGFATAAMANSTGRADAYFDDLLAIGNSGDYFKETTRALYLLLAADLFPASCP